MLSIAVGSLCVSVAFGQQRTARPAPRAAAALQRQLAEQYTIQRDVEYGKAGDRALLLDLIVPKAKSGKPRPVIVWIHGGGWQNGNKDSGAGRLAPLLAGGEYIGASIGYRLSGEATWPAQIYDCKAAIRWLRASAAQYNIDPERIGLWGSSAGGHLVSLLGTSGEVKELEGNGGNAGYSSRVACVVDFCGPSDFLAFGLQSPRMQQPEAPLYKLFGGPLAEKETQARAASPVTHVSADDPPFLVVHGTQDNTVPVKQAELFEAALKKAGVDVTYVKMEGGGHGIGGPEITRRVGQFFARHLLGKDVTVSSEPIAVLPVAR
jgi:acetyl esterase/lipase